MPEPTPAPRRFTLDEANALLPRVRRVTEEAMRQVESLTNRLQTIGPGSNQYEQLEQSLNDAIAQWADAIQSLGVEVKGLWLVDFDNGEGYYCWKHPEPAISHYHGYADGFAGRMKIV